MVKNHSVSGRGNTLPPLHRLLFPISSNVLLYAPYYRQDSTYHGLCYTYEMYVFALLFVVVFSFVGVGFFVFLCGVFVIMFYMVSLS